MISREYHSWIENASATNDTATATKAAPSGGLRHFITSISGSFDATAAGVALTLSDGATALGTWYVYDEKTVVFSSPIVLSAGNAANLALAAGGAGIVGEAVLTGYTL